MRQPRRPTTTGKEPPIDKVLYDGESVTLGGMTLVAHLTPGHSRGCTTWMLKAREGGRAYDHPGMCNLEEKNAKLGKGGPNPFIDPTGYKLEVDIDAAMFRAVLVEQQNAVGSRGRP